MIAALCSLSAFSQGGEDGIPELRLRWLRQNNFTWSTSLDFTQRLTKGKYRLEANLHHDNILNTSLETDKFVQMYFRSSIWQYYKLRDSLEIASWIETDQFVNTQNEKYSIYAGVAYQPFRGLRLTPLIGYSFDRRSGTLDQGFSPAVIASFNRELQEGLVHNTSVFLRYKFIHPRQQRNVTVMHQWKKQFDRNTWLLAGVNGGTHELDDYATTEVQRIISDTIRPNFSLFYRFPKLLTWESDNELMYFRRRFNYEPMAGEDPATNNLAFSGMSFQTSQRIGLRHRKMEGYFLYQYQLYQRRYELENNTGVSEPVFEQEYEQEKQKDFRSNQHMFEIFGKYNLNRKHSLDGRYIARYLMYDTPSEDNFDDRDEITYTADLHMNSNWHPKFRTQYGLSGSFRHYAFLLEEKSQDNYKQRSLRADFKFGWDLLQDLLIEGENAVYVTYNVKDFIDFNRTDRSTRNLETNYKFRYRPDPKWEIRGRLNRREMHQSYLNWEAFSETTLDTTVFSTVETGPRYFFELGEQKYRLYTDLWYRHYTQKKKFRASMNTTDNLIVPISLHEQNYQTGPVTGIGYRDQRNSQIELSCWYQVQVRKNKFREAGEQVVGVQNFHEEDLREKSAVLRPYLTLNINYFLP